MQSLLWGGIKWFSCELMSEKRLQKFHTVMTCHNLDLNSASNWLCCRRNLLQPIRHTAPKSG